MSEPLRGVLGYKGERGYSAYEIAVQNGFIGTVQDWLAFIGTTSHFSENSVVHTSTANQKVFDLPSIYTSNSFIDIYINGMRLQSNRYTINTSTRKITLTFTLDAGATVEIVTLTMSTNNMPIVQTIAENSTDNTAPSTKATYDFVNGKFAIVEGTIPSIAVGSNDDLMLDFPSGFTGANCVVLNKMCLAGDFWVDTVDESRADYPIITLVKLGTALEVNMKNVGSTVQDGKFRIILMKI